MKHPKDHGHTTCMIFAPSSWRNEKSSESLPLLRSFWTDRRCPRLGVLQCPCLSAANSESQPTIDHLTETCPAGLIQHLQDDAASLHSDLVLSSLWAGKRSRNGNLWKAAVPVYHSISVCRMPGILVAKPQVNHVIACGWFALADANRNSGRSTARLLVEIWHS